jgi:hypothetical protein
MNDTIRQFSGPFFDSAVRDAYDRSKHKKPAVAAAAKRMGCSKITIYKRAVELGLIHVRPRKVWSEPEKAILRANAHLCARTIHRKLKQAGYDRSDTAIYAARVKFVGAVDDIRLDADITTGYQLAHFLGTTSIVVSKWARQGLIAGKKVDGKGTHGEWHFRSRDIREFLVTYTAHVNFAHADKFWLVDILVRKSGVKIANRREIEAAA